jgi:hypothetical protein
MECCRVNSRIEYRYLVAFSFKYARMNQAAVRALVFKWIRIIYRCWQTRTEYNEVKYLENLRKKRSPLLSYAASNPE